MIHSLSRNNSSQDCTSVDREDPDFRDTVNTTEDLLSYLQLLETGLPLLIVCLVGPLSGQITFLIVSILSQISFLMVSIITFTGRSSRQEVVYVWQSGWYSSTTTWLPPALPFNPLTQPPHLGACSPVHSCLHCRP